MYLSDNILLNKTTNNIFSYLSIYCILIYACVYYTIALISHASKVMLKILQARLQQYVNCEFPDVQAGF